MKTSKKETLKSRRENKLYTPAFLPKGNGKLLDYTDENGVNYRYAQVNTRPIIDCPFKSAGCQAVCYATKGNHVFSSVKESRERSFQETKREDFSDAMIYTIETEKMSKRYNGSIMIIRQHESGDFYSLQYLKKWVSVWNHFLSDESILFVFYTKSFRFFNMLSDAEKIVIKKGQENGRIAISCSLDDTTTSEQKNEYLKMIANYPLTNTYYCTEHVESIAHDNVCDCANCAKCGTCNKATGEKTVVKIHSASRDDMKVYRENIVA